MRILTLGGKMLTSHLREAGHEIMSLGPPGSAHHAMDREAEFFQSPESARAVLHGLCASFRPDWLLQVDDSTPIAHLALENLRVPKAWYAIDSHLHWEWHRHYAPVFDVVFCAQKKHVPDLGAFGVRVEWLPLYFPNEPEFLPWAGRKHDVSFVGTLDSALNPARVRLLDTVKERGLNIMVMQGDPCPVYRNSRVVINQSANDDLNNRFFEAIGFGALLVTDRLTHSLLDICEPDTDFLVYEPGDALDLEAKVRWALAHPAEAEAMARRAQKKILANHRTSNRSRRIMDVFSDLSAAGPEFSETGRLSKSSRATIEPGHLLGHLAAAHEHLSRLALPGPLVDFLAGEARRLAVAALQTSPREPWSLLVLSQLELENGAIAEAFRWLNQVQVDGMDGAVGVDVMAGDLGYRRSYVFLKALLLAHTGRKLEAQQAANSGLRDFPEDPNLKKLAVYLDEKRGV